MFNLKYPSLIICSINGRIVITTHKIGSRFFEQKAGKCSDWKKYEPHFRWNTHDTSVTIPEPSINTQFNFSHGGGLEQKTKSFCDLVGVDKIEDIFTTQPITFITRDPWSRFWSGLFEVIGENNNEKINQIDKAILNDTHLSLWNTFLIELILHYEIKEHEIIDLNNPLITERYGVKTIDVREITNKFKYKPWLENEDNKVYIEKLQTILKPYMDLEINSYNKLLNYE